MIKDSFENFTIPYIHLLDQINELQKEFQANEIS